jgi:diguanylate cyclase (GGDEF)-like protein
MSQWIEHIANIAVSGGFVCALAIICFLQYVMRVWQASRHRQESNGLRRQMECLESELACLESDRWFAEIENQALRDFTAEEDLDLALKRLLQLFIPSGSDGFAAFVLTSGSGCRVRQAHGLCEQSAARLTLDAALIERLGTEPLVTLTSAELASTQLYASLREADRPRANPLYLVRAIGDEGEVEAVVVATALFPCGTDLRRQWQLVRRVLDGIGNHLRRTEMHREQEQELRVAREILELRSIVDLEFRSPTEMLEDFLGRLAVVTGFEQAALYLAPRRENEARLFVRHAAMTFARENRDWEDLEQALAIAEFDAPHLRQHTSGELLRLCNGELPFAQAITSPVLHGDRAVGVICLTRVSSGPIGTAETELVQWAANYLLESMLRTADRAVIERQARRDALTGLANRHTFDAILEERVAEACATGRPCSLVLLDMDHFKSVNDLHGHLAGDEALRIVGGVIHEESSRQLRGTDRPLAARYGGEELALILPGVNLKGAERVAEAIRSRVASTEISYEGAAIPITLSAGVATAPEQGTTVRELVAAADAALYRAKTNGRDRVEAAPRISTAMASL